MKKKLLLFLTSTILSIIAICFVLINQYDAVNFIKANVEPYSLNLTSLNSSNNTLITSKGNDIEFDISQYNGGVFSQESSYTKTYIKNKTAISGLESLTISFETTDADLLISYGWFYNEYYSTGNVINSNNSTYYFDNLCPSFFKIENKNSSPVTITDIRLIYSCSESELPEGYTTVEYTLANDGLSYYVSGCNFETRAAIILPEYNGKPVTSIGRKAFYEHYFLNYVFIPEGVASIESDAFCECDSLTTVIIPNTVTSIVGNPFENCTSLSFNLFDGGCYLGNTSNPYIALVKAESQSIASCNIHNNCRFICGSAFSGCSSLESVSIPNGVTSIAYYAFQNCSSLISLTIPDSVTSMAGSGIFYGCSSLSSITLSKNITAISQYAFYNCSSLLSIDIPDNVTEIGDSAFRNCSSLTSVVIPNNVTEIGGNAFRECFELSSVTIGNNVRYIRSQAFYYCSKLSSITFGSNLLFIDNETFYHCSSLGSIVIPDSVQTIYQYAFEFCSSLTYAFIPNSVTKVYSHIFKGCSLSLTIYCEEDSQPSAWESSWNWDASNNRYVPVVWGSSL